jgi:hypothetical protein
MAEEEDLKLESFGYHEHELNCAHHHHSDDDIKASPMG